MFRLVGKPLVKAVVMSNQLEDILSLLAKSNSPLSIRMEMNGKVPRVLLAKTYRCLPKLRTKSTRTCTSRMVLLASDGFLRPTCTTGLSALQYSIDDWAKKVENGGMRSSPGGLALPKDGLSCIFLSGLLPTLIGQDDILSSVFVIHAGATCSTT